MMNDVDISLLNIMKKENLIDLIKEYSDYTIDIGGISIDRYITKEYLKDKRKDDVIIKTEIEEDAYKQDEYDIIEEVFNKHFSHGDKVISPFNNYNVNHYDFKQELYEAIENYKKENW